MTITEIQNIINIIKTQLTSDFFNIELQMECAKWEKILEDHTDPRF